MEKITVVSANDTGRTWSKDGKTFKITTLVLADGRVGETMSEKFTEGEHTAIITEREWQGQKTLSFKYVAPQGTTYAGGSKYARDPEAEKQRQQMIIRQSSLERSMEGAIQGFWHKSEILQQAQTFVDWVNKLN